MIGATIWQKQCTEIDAESIILMHYQKNDSIWITFKAHLVVKDSIATEKAV